MERMGREEEKPPWLDHLLSKEFFGACEEHQELKKCEVNLFCIDCRLCMCQYCLSPDRCSHDADRHLQIRRYVYQDVVRFHDLHKLLDCSKVQTYTVNSAKVVLLNPRKQCKPSCKPSSSPVCQICRRCIASESNRYCSIACKMSEAFSKSKPSPSRQTSSDPVSSSSQEPASASSSSASSSQPSDSSEDNEDRPIPDSPARRFRKCRKKQAQPLRSPFF